MREFSFTFSFINRGVRGGIDNHVWTERPNALANCLWSSQIETGSIGREDLAKINKQRIQIAANLAILSR
jgi:hypothetical protein